DGEIWTIGFGRTENVRRGDVTTWAGEEEWTRARIRRDIDVVRAVVLRQVLPVDMWAVLLDFVYNVGASKFQASTLARRLRQDRLADVDDEARRWVYAHGRVLPGLKRRRETFALLWNAALPHVSMVTTELEDDGDAQGRGRVAPEPIPIASTDIGQATIATGGVSTALSLVAYLADLWDRYAPAAVGAAILLVALGLLGYYLWRRTRR
ncbi:MAG: glycoside hydrolase family protein, partial [Dehalococcoidia bacterium]|nr:glycoside hydrolase family protein [Dehalococcoidia bacterium]